jgi:hypothetical protein
MFFNEATTECTSYKVWKKNDFNGFRRNSPVGSVGSIFVGALHRFVNHKKRWHACRGQSGVEIVQAALVLPLRWIPYCLDCPLHIAARGCIEAEQWDPRRAAMVHYV